MLMLTRYKGQAVHLMYRDSGEMISTVTVQELFPGTGVARLSFSTPSDSRAVTFTRDLSRQQFIDIMNPEKETEILITVMVLDFIPNGQVRLGFDAQPSVRIVRDNAINRAGPTGSDP